MSTLSNIKSHFASSGVTAPGFAVPGAATGAHPNGGGTTTPHTINSPSTAPTTNYFTNASSSYQSHFGDFGGGGVNIGIVPGRSSSNTSAVSASVGVVGGGVPSASGSGAAVRSPSATAASSIAGLGNAPAPIGTTPTISTTTTIVAAAAAAAVPPTAIGTASPLTISNSVASAPSSHGNSPHTASLTPTVKFATPTALGTSPKTASAFAAATSIDNSLNDIGSAAPPETRKAATTFSPPQQSLLPPSSTSTAIKNGNSPSPNKTPGGSSSSTQLAGPTPPPPLPQPRTTTTATTVEAAVRAMDEAALGDAARHVAPRRSPNSPASPHSGTPSPTNAAPRMDTMMVLTPTSATQLAAQTQHQPHSNAFPAAAPLTPVSAHSSSSRHSNPASREPMVSVYDSDFKTLLSIPTSQVVHRPHPSLGVSRLVLCRNYTPDHPGNCTKGELCKFVHADVSSASRCSIHVNYAWRSLELCAYPRLPAGDTLTVLAPNERPPSETIASELVLVTRGSTNWREHAAPLSHCAHYYFNRMCNRGERCNFIHAVHVDPQVQGDFKRAPAPTAVAPIVSRSPTSPALHSLGHGADGLNSPSAAAAAAAAAAASAAASASMSPVYAVPPPPPPPPMPPCAAYGFAPTMYTPPPPPPPPLPPPGSMAFPMSHSPTVGGGSYMLFSSTAGPGGAGYVPTTLVPPPPSHLGNSNGVYLLVPAHTGMGSNGNNMNTGSSSNGVSPNSPVSPLGQSLGSLSNGPVDWSFYGDLETAAWMPPSPSSRI